MIEFSEDSYTGSESDDAIVFDVVVTMGGIDKDVVLNFSTSDNTAIGQYTFLVTSDTDQNYLSNLI